MTTDQILVVDDEPDIAESLAVLFGEVMGLKVIVAPNASKGLEELKKANQDLRLIVSDYRMPGMDGLEFLAEAARLRPDVQRILLTAYPDTQLAVDALNRAGVERFLTKPVDGRALETLVKQLLAAQRAERQRKTAFERTVGTLRRDRPDS